MPDTTTTLVGFLLARLDEIERLARGAAEAAPLRTGDMDGVPAGSRWACETMRELIKRHAPDGNPKDPWHGDDVRCTECGGYELVAGYGERGRRTHWPCPTLKLLAGAFDSHPDYQEAWRP